jgi:hypothetical protein
MHHAFDDGRYAYTLGFYPTHRNWNGKFRKIKIETQGMDLRLRYRAGYLASADHSDPGEMIEAQLQGAAANPLEATSIGMIVSGKLAGPVSSRNLELHIGIDPKQLLLESSDGHQKGGVDLFFVQRDGDGKTVGTEKQHIRLDLDEKQFEYLTRAAMVFDRHLVVATQASEIRVIVRDSGSGAIGSVTVPVKDLLTAGENPPASKK